MDEFRRQGIALIGTATTADEAIALEQSGVDVIAASGFEAGGHRGSFLQLSEDSLTGTMALVPQVVDVVNLPVVAAGGIGDARGIVAAFALGAEGVQMGTAFLACEESGANPLHRKALLGGQVQTALTRGLTGRLARGIKNRLLDTLNQKDVELLPFIHFRWKNYSLSNLVRLRCGITCPPRVLKYYIRPCPPIKVKVSQQLLKCLPDKSQELSNC